MIPCLLDLYLLYDEGSPSLRPVSLHVYALLMKVRVHFSEDHRRENTANVKRNPLEHTKQNLTFRRTSNFIPPIVVFVFSFFSFFQHERKFRIISVGQRFIEKISSLYNPNAPTLTDSKKEEK
jgi:hypothetical protein